MPFNLRNRHFLELDDYTPEVIAFLLQLSAELKAAKYAGVPVWNGLTNEFHPTQILADLLTMQEYSHKPLQTVTCCFLGDVGSNVGNSLMLGAAKMGMDGYAPGGS